MNKYLILRLQGVMQSWGGHTYEDYRPSLIFPSRSGLVGLLGACLGIKREDAGGIEALSGSFTYCARLDAQPHPVRKITDFHTVLDARKVDGSRNKNPVVSHREYLCDARFSVALEFGAQADYTMNQVRRALAEPIYTPFLGRRSCPFTVPPLYGVVEAASLHDALTLVPPGRGVLYSEIEQVSPNRISVRDVPAGHRLFHTRNVYIHAPEGDDVPEQS